MFFWNKVEVYCGFSVNDFSELRNSLTDANIKYDYKMVHLNNLRARTGSLGQNSNYNIQYYLYVHQKDYDNAMHQISNRNRH